MGRKPLKHVDGPVSVPAAGTHDFYFNFPEKTDPYMLDMVVGQALCSANGCFCTLYLIQGGQTMMFERAQLTGDYPSSGNMLRTQFLMSVGDILKCRFSNLSAADTIEWTVRGH